MPVVRDDAIIEAIAAAIDATGAFGAAIAGSPWTDPVGQPVRRAAWVARTGWTQQDRTVESKDRTVQFKVWLSVVAGSARDARREAARLEAEIVKAIDGSSLGGLVQPSQTMIARGRDLPEMEGPSWTVELDGRFRYRVAGFGAVDTTDRT